MSELDKWNEIIEDLRGTCKSLDSVLYMREREDLRDNAEFLAELDEQIFECSQCGWWCEINEEASNSVGAVENICRDCAEDYDYED